MTLTEIKKQAKEFGQKVREAENTGDYGIKRRVRNEWDAFKEEHVLPHPQTMDIIKAYTRAYIGNE